jgi:TRAP-type transport system small permease protein
VSHPTEEVHGRWIARLVTVERLLAAGLLATVLASMGAQVVARYVFGAPIPWSEEVARFALIWLTFLAAGFVMAEGRHISVDVISSRLSPRGKLRLECLSAGLVVSACLLLLLGGFRFVWYVGEVGSPALGIPMSWWYGAASVGLGLMATHGSLNLVYALRTGRPIWVERLPGDDELHVGKRDGQGKRIRARLAKRQRDAEPGGPSSVDMRVGSQTVAALYMGGRGQNARQIVPWNSFSDPFNRLRRWIVGINSPRRKFSHQEACHSRSCDHNYADEAGTKSAVKRRPSQLCKRSGKYA